MHRATPMKPTAPAAKTNSVPGSGAPISRATPLTL